MFFKLGVLKNFAILTEKTPVLESLFNEVVIKMEVFYKKDVLKNFAIFTGKHLSLV